MTDCLMNTELISLPHSFITSLHTFLPLSSILSTGRCKDAFDFSDHVVLHMAQYMIPSAIELAYVYLQCTRTDIKAASVYKYFLTIISAASIIAISLRGILQTGMFFHSGAENVTAGLVVFVFVIAPLLKWSNSSFFVKALLPTNGTNTAD